METKIKTFFEKQKLVLDKPGQVLLRTNTTGIAELTKLAKEFQQETKIPIYILCQNQINDCLVLMQKYCKDKKKTVKNDTANRKK